MRQPIRRCGRISRGAASRAPPRCSSGTGSDRGDRVAELIRRCSPWVLALLAVTLIAGSLDAQSIQGSVRDLVSGQPLAGAVIVLVAENDEVQARAVSDSTGNFSIGAAEGSVLRLFVQRAGYRSLETAPFTLDASDHVAIVAPLHPQAAPIEEVAVTVSAPRNLNFERFQSRRELGFGRYVGPADIAEIGPRSTVQLVSVMHPSATISGSGRGISFPTGTSRCTPVVFVDGRQVTDQVRAPVPRRQPHRLDDDGAVLDRFAPVASVRAVEVYTNPSTAPQEFRWAFMPQCGIVVIWTAYGFGLDRVPEARLPDAENR